MDCASVLLMYLALDSPITESYYQALRGRQYGWLDSFLNGYIRLHTVSTFS